MLDAMRDELKKFCESGDCRNCILSTQCDELEEKCGYDLSTCEKYPNEWIPPIYHYYKLRNMCTGRPCNDQCPAFRTGCKLAVININGDFIYKDVIYPHKKNENEIVSEERILASEKKIVDIVNKFYMENFKNGF